MVKKQQPNRGMTLGDLPEGWIEPKERKEAAKRKDKFAGWGEKSLLKFIENPQNPIRQCKQAKQKLIQLRKKK